MDWEWFASMAQTYSAIPLYERIFSDTLTPVEAYRRLAAGDAPGAPSFLFESVNDDGGQSGSGKRAGRYSFVGARPSIEVVSYARRVEVQTNAIGAAAASTEVREDADPLSLVAEFSAAVLPAPAPGLPPVFTGGWVGYAGYDSVRYGYTEDRLGFSRAPRDDRGLPDVHLARYDDVTIFDDADKLAYLVSWAHVAPGTGETEARAAYDDACRRLQESAGRLQGARGAQAPPPVRPARVVGNLARRPALPGRSNLTREQFLDGVRAAQEHMLAGDIFQLVFSQRFERTTRATPFEIYRALRVVNPSPYMAYLQARDCVLVASSPEILCRVDAERVVTNRPLAGTRHRGSTEAEDRALEADLRADAKETAEHVMLVDLGRNDVGRVSLHGSVKVDKLMEIERYSHVMHISSTVTGKLRPELNAWDALRAALPVGTISGAPKVRAMQLIDELEPTRRGPYGGGIGYLSYSGTLDMCLALRTLVVPAKGEEAAGIGEGTRRERTVHLQVGAGLVADSVPEHEFEETVNKSAALGRAIDLAEDAFLG